MESKTSFNIKVTARPVYDSKNSYPLENRFVFRYDITIENLSKIPIQLLRREWLIYDLGFGFTEVKGEGVIGLTPVILPGHDFDYFSNVLLSSGVGYMTGEYQFRNLLTQELIHVEIPKFKLHSLVLCN
ncbi:Co2+/Mg2+ efflux protein ApaG [Chryseobacterium sp. A301]